MSGSGSASSSGAIAAGRVLGSADVAPDDAADLAQVELLRERRRRRHGGEGEEAVQLARGVRDEVAVGREHLGALLDRPEGRAADDRAHLVQAEEERGDDAEVAAAAADRPVQVGVLVRRGADPLAAREHDLGLEQVVDRQAALAGQVADAAAEGEAADAGGRDDPARRRQPVLVGRGVDFAPDAAAADPHRAGLRIDLDVLQAREVEDDAVVTGPQAGAVVAAAADREQELVVAGEGDDLGDVVGVGAARRSAPGAGRSSRCRPRAPRRSRRRRGRSAVPRIRRSRCGPSASRVSGVLIVFLLAVVSSHFDEARARDCSCHDLN